MEIVVSICGRGCMHVHRRSRIFHDVTLPFFRSERERGVFIVVETRNDRIAIFYRVNATLGALATLSFSLLLFFFFLSSLWKPASCPCYHTVAHVPDFPSVNRRARDSTEILPRVALAVESAFSTGRSRKARETMHPRLDHIYMAILVDRLWSFRGFWNWDLEI